MPHGILVQARQAIGLARYLPHWQQNLLAAALLAGGVALLVFGDLAGIAPLALVALFGSARIRETLANPPATERRLASAQHAAVAAPIGGTPQSTDYQAPGRGAGEPRPRGAPTGQSRSWRIPRRATARSGRNLHSSSRRHYGWSCVGGRCSTRNTSAWPNSWPHSATRSLLGRARETAE
jgi:hypothetical protein